MIELWSWPTPNGQKVHIALEELGLPYRALAVDIGAGQQFRPEFLAITPTTAFRRLSIPKAPAAD